jgi:putative chitinase
MHQEWATATKRAGDGYRYCGRGLIQLTGKDNYTFFAGSTRYHSRRSVNILATFEGAAQSACWFWEQNNLNRFADANDVKGLTRAINGGYIGKDNKVLKNITIVMRLKNSEVKY